MDKKTRNILLAVLAVAVLAVAIWLIAGGGKGVGKRIAVADKRSLALFDSSGKQLYFTRFPAAISHLWCKGGSIYVVSDGRIQRVGV